MKKILVTGASGFLGNPLCKYLINNGYEVRALARNEGQLSKLKQEFNIDKLNAESVAPFAGGSVSSALSLIENDFEHLKEKTIFILRYSFGRKYNSALNEFASFINESDSESI